MSVNDGAIPQRKAGASLSSRVNKVVAGLLLAAGLSIGGYAVASAQSTPTTTTPSTPSTTAPANGSHQNNSNNPNCPNMGGSGSGSGQAANTAAYSM